jgi:putative transposase
MPPQGRSNEEIVHALHQVEGGEKVAEVCRRLGVGEQTFYRWKKQFAGLGIQELCELRSLRDENRKLKQVVADLTLGRHILQEIVRGGMRLVMLIEVAAAGTLPPHLLKLTP